MSRYTKEHYEDVAKALKENRAWAIQMDSAHARGVMASTIGTFADLFAADAPEWCGRCESWKSGYASPEGYCCLGRPHAWKSKFNREQFLAACGLES
ncbi:hypothetical protein LCGC14_2085040 [marine sediment metagenome]|uniref:Uncharacterized protein n=1 Tax=marine sediment metagenome TaxID=412755 RepID=A0A0F9EEB0_9ZZZZ